MSRYRTIIISLALVGALLLTVGAVAAGGGGGNGKGHNKPRVGAVAPKGGGGNGQAQNKPQQARMTWSAARVEQTVAPGQTVVVNVTLTSSADVTNVALRVPGGLGRVLKVEPSSFASLKAGVATPVKLTIAMPALGAHSQAGVIQVRVGPRNVPAALNVKLTVPHLPGDNGTAH